MDKLSVATLWAKLLIITTVNFGNNTKLFSENFVGWVL